jgi:RNA polymerase sigma factor (sigma-70 family)
MSDLAAQRAYLDLLSTTGDALLHYLFDLTGDRAMAEDLCQDCFAAAWRHRAQLRDPAKGRSWLFAIASNAARAQFRRDGVLLRQTTAMANAVRALPQWEMPESDLDLRRALASLAPEDRDVVLLVGYQGYTIPEAAALMGLGAEAAGKRWQRACVRLNRAMHQQTPVPREARHESV